MAGARFTAGFSVDSFPINFHQIFTCGAAPYFKKKWTMHPKLFHFRKILQIAKNNLNVIKGRLIDFKL